MTPSDILKQATKFAYLVSLAQQSSQLGELYIALVDKGNLGLKYVGGRPKGNEVPEVEWDLNSPTANTIFGLFDKAGFKGTATVSVVVDPNQQAAVKVQTMPANTNLASAISKALTPNVSGAVASVPAPSQTLTVPDVITAQNA